MNIVFLGTPRAAVPAFEALLVAGHRIPLVVTQPDRPAGRSERPRSPEVKLAAARHGIHIVQPVRVRTPEFLADVARAKPDVLVTVAYGRILPEPVLAVAPFGAVNVHFSLLPGYRGAAPVQWALARGETSTGVTTMQMNARLDEGDILSQTPLEIQDGEHAPALQDRLATAGAALLVATLAGLSQGSVRPRPQDAAQATFAPQLTRQDGEADFALPARQIEGRVRGFDPWPGVWTHVRGRRMRIRRARAIPGRGSADPHGTLIDFESSGFLVACGDRTVLLVSSLQPESAREISAADARNGRLVAVGDRFERTAPVR